MKPMVLPGREFRRASVRGGGFTLDYAEAGPANPQAVIVSLPGSAGLEMSIAKDRLAQSYRVIEINPPGWGGKTDVNRPMSQRELGSILAEAAGALVRGRYYVIGTSMGGTNALYLAQSVPQQVAGIIHEGSMAPCRPQDLRSGPMTPEQVKQMVEAMTKGEASGYGLPPPHPNKPWATAQYVARQMLDRGNMMRWVPADLAASSAMAVVRQEKIPLLALLGDADQILKVSQQEAYRAELPEAQFLVIAGGEHDLQNTAPDEFVQHVRAFIDSNRSSS